jgi:type IV secretory pathway ATPase VirB11/archaellum biosynthesis ATPase
MRTTNFSVMADKYNEVLSSYILPSPYAFMEYLSHCNGKTILQAARPAMGKTALMLSIIKEYPELPALVFTLEMSTIQLVNRF